MQKVNQNTPTIKIGVLAPLSKPGWTDAGKHLLTGMQCAAETINSNDRVNGHDLELVIKDTAASPQQAITAVNDLAEAGVVALAGEYHSVVARAAATRASELNLQYLCSSAVLDDLVEGPAKDLVARIAPTQSYSWSIFAGYLRDQGLENIAVVIDSSSVYWRSGVRILRENFAAHGGTVKEVEARSFSLESICDELARDGVDAVLLLCGFPEMGLDIVKAIRKDARLRNVKIGAPAGQPEFADWLKNTDRDEQVAIPFLRYMPDMLSSTGLTVEKDLHERLGESPSFVAFEGYDTIVVLSSMLRSAPPEEGSRMSKPWSNVHVEGTRGTIHFSRQSGTGIWQWTWPPVQMVDRDPGAPSRFRVLRQCTAS